MPDERTPASVSDERLDWIERWAQSWRTELGDPDPASESYYAQLPLAVAVSMIEELAAEVRRVR